MTGAESRRRFPLDAPDEMTRIERDGDAAWIRLLRRGGIKLQELWYCGRGPLPASTAFAPQCCRSDFSAHSRKVAV